MRIWHVLTLLPLLGGCAEGPLDPAAALLDAGAEGGLEQLVDAQVTTDNGRSHFTITSTLRNTGDQPVTLTVRSCYLRASDIRGDRERLRLHEPLMLCATNRHEIVLAPGEASAPLLLSGEMQPGTSRDVEVRHALLPERWAPVTLTAP